MSTNLLIKYYFRIEEEIVVPIGAKLQKGSIFVVLQTRKLWKKESFRNKIKSILSFKWKMNERDVLIAAQEIAMRDIFGTRSDYGEELLNLMAWHNSRDWNFDLLEETDILKADGMEVMSGLSRLRYRETSNLLNINIVEYTPFMCSLINAMVVKIPVVSCLYYLDIHCSFAFNSIRKSKHPYASEIISYLYEILFIQQKTAVSLHEYLRLIDFAEREKNEALFIQAEVNAIIYADLIFSYLKATVEKTIVLIGLTHSIPDLESKKEHKGKLKTLKLGLPKHLNDVFYVQFIMEYNSSENLDELNKYRTGLLHKKGISDLQPHNFVGKKAQTTQLLNIFNVLHEQHSKNTGILIGAFALLTDELVNLDPPSISIQEIPIPKSDSYFFQQLNKYFEKIVTE